MPSWHYGYRPDAVSGMLPPKLAQTMVNLGIDGKTRLAVYDPFCGNGRVLLEATLQEIEIFGSDLREIQVEASKENLAWLSQEYDLPYVTDNHLWVADAAKGPGRKIGQPFVIVSEPYLGKPLRSRLGLGEHKSWLDDLVPLYTAFIEYWAQSLEQPEKMIVIFPRTTAVDGREISVFDTVVDRLHQVGYSAEVLFCYSRPDSIVERDIVKIKKSQHY
jgi:tRNA G10  N-methylase Trm11